MSINSNTFIFCNAFYNIIYCNIIFLFLLAFFLFCEHVSCYNINQSTVYFNCIGINMFFNLSYMFLFYNCYINHFLQANLFFSERLPTVLWTDRGLNFCLSAPAGKLCSRYAHQLLLCRCNTVHSNVFIPFDNSAHPATINWGLSDVHVLLADQVINCKT